MGFEEGDFDMLYVAATVMYCLAATTTTTTTTGAGEGERSRELRPLNPHGPSPPACRYLPYALRIRRSFLRTELSNATLRVY